MEDLGPSVPDDPTQSPRFGVVSVFEYEFEQPRMAVSELEREF